MLTCPGGVQVGVVSAPREGGHVTGGEAGQGGAWAGLPYQWRSSMAPPIIMSPESEEELQERANFHDLVY